MTFQITWTRLLFGILLNAILTIPVVLILSERHYSILPSIDSRLKRETSCKIGQFRCNNGECIPVYDKCDGEAHCTDGTDEIQATCEQLDPDGKECFRFKGFRCAYGGCIPRDKMCNGIKDCPDNSDELMIDCPNFRQTNATKKCGLREFQCQSGMCIHWLLACDGKADCDDGSDETITHCYQEQYTCPSGNFRCAYGACITSTLKCDGKVDCADRSDEESILCGYKNSMTKTTTEPSTTQSVPETSDCKLTANLSGTTYSVINTGIIRIDCEENYSPCKTDGSCLTAQFGYIICQNKSFNDSNLKCVEKCKPLKSVSIKYVCYYQSNNENVEVNCSIPLKPGTTATMSCADGYLKSASFRDENKCVVEGGRGKWKHHPSKFYHSCNADCGVKFVGVAIKPLVANGNAISDISEFPWNVAIYQMIGNKLSQQCGGTIISANLILTAAHCVYNKTSSKVIQTSEFKIVAGKYFRDFEKPESHVVQTVDVVNISIPQNYRGVVTQFEYDIAVVEVITIQFNSYIMPACLWLNENHHSLHNQFGYVVGWGRDETGTNTEEIRSAKLRYTRRDECSTLSTYKITAGEFEDKFCAYNNATRVLQGDSGAGLTFSFDDGRHFLYGIVSISYGNLSWFTDLTNEQNRKFVKSCKQEFDDRNNEIDFSK